MSESMRIYDEAAMSPELRKVRQQNDKAMIQAYGFSIKDITDGKCAAKLMRMYQSLTGDN